MYINFQSLSRLPVVTESGIKLGKVYDIKFEIESQIVTAYLARSYFFGKDTYLIKPNQIKAITAEKIIVYDAIANGKELIAKKAKRPGTEMAGSTISVRDIS